MNNKTENEVWKTYPEFSFVEVSSIGRVRTLDRVVVRKNGRMYVAKGRVLKQRDNGDGYLHVEFRLNGKPVHRYVHRLVAQTFIPNPDNLPEVNHKNGNRACNDISNLEWVTHKENIEYREKYGESQGRPVYAVNLKTLEVSRFESQREASRELGINQRGIWGVIKGERIQTKGYWFTIADDNAVEAVKSKFGDKVANKVAELMDEN